MPYCQQYNGIAYIWMEKHIFRFVPGRFAHFMFHWESQPDFTSCAVEERINTDWGQCHNIIPQSTAYVLINICKALWGAGWKAA